MRKLFFISCCVLILCGCKQNPHITFVNNTNRIIVYDEEITFRNDTTISTDQCDNGTLYDIAPNGEYTLIARGLIWKDYFEKNPTKSVHIYVTYADTLQKYGKCTVLKKRIFKKIYNITYEDAKRMNWRIEFNGR